MTVKRNWQLLFSYFLVLLLSVEVVLLTLQNKKLKELLNTTTSLGLNSDALQPGEHVKPIMLQTLDGSLSSLKYDDPNKSHLLLVLSTTCPHCEKNLVRWKLINESNRRDNCEIVGISIHDLDATRKYVVERKPGFYITSAGADTGFYRGYKLVGVPETILVRSDGSVQKVWIGELSSDQTTEIEALLRPEKSSTN
jgi:peroxiredoxin